LSKDVKFFEVFIADNNNLQPISSLVNEEFRNILLSMGFSKVVAEKSLFFTHNKSIDEAMDWVASHQNDNDLEEELFIQKIVNQSKRTKEEIDQIAKDLSKKQHEKFMQKEKVNELELEKQRRLYQKELLPAKKLADEQEEKRLLELKISEKKKFEDEKKKMEEQLRKDYELRFGKKYEEKKEEDKQPEY